MKTILATAYAVNPNKGSEDGMGWNYIMQIARFNKVIAITRENNQPHIERYQKENPNALYENIRFLYFDLPYWMRFWKRGERGAMLYYWLWQKNAVGFMQRQNISFDIVHNLNFHNDWTPSYLWKLNKPFVWGPVGHHPKIPAQYLSAYSFKYKIKDHLSQLVKHYFWNVSPDLQACKQHASFIWCMNSKVPQTLHIQKQPHCIIPSVASEDFGWEDNRSGEQFNLISVGRLVPLKGFDLTIRAFGIFIKRLTLSEAEKCRLIIIGSGPEYGHYQGIVSEQNIGQYVSFIEWMERKEVMQRFKQSSVFIFPSHEGAGMVVPEALSFALPVICLDNEGPGEFIDAACGFAVPMGTYEQTVNSLADKLEILFRRASLRKQMSRCARQRFEELFHWDRRGDKLKEIYEQF